MHIRTLSSMVAAATQDAERAIKMASAADAVRTSEDFDLQKLAEDGLPPEAVEKKRSEKSEKSEKDEKRDDKEKKAAVDHAMKLAEALRIAAPMVEKLAAQSPLDAPGPAVVASPQVGAQQLPKPPKAKTDPGKSGVGSTGTLATNAKDVASVDWTKNKEAGAAYVQAKLAQAELLAKLGQSEAAEHILAKLAQDPSSPQPSLPPNSGPAGGLQLMPDVPSGRVPESPAAIASMTRATAKDPTTKTVTEFIQEAPKKDNMVAPTQMTANGLKVSHVVEKLAAKKEASMPAVGSFLFGPVGAALGGGAEGEPKRRVLEGALRGAGGDVAGRIGGAMVGAALGGTLGAIGGSQAAAVGAGVGAGAGSLIGGPVGAHMATRAVRESGKTKKSAADDAPGIYESAAREKVAISASKIVAAAQKSVPERLAKAGNTKWSNPVIQKTLARSKLREGRLDAAIRDLPFGGADTPKFRRSQNENTLQSAIHAAHTAAALGTRG